MGRALWPVVISFKQWGDRWLNDGEAPVALVHKRCGTMVEPRMTCPKCGDAMEAHETEARLSEDFAIERRSALKT